MFTVHQKITGLGKMSRAQILVYVCKAILVKAIEKLRHVLDLINILECGDTDTMKIFQFADSMHIRLWPLPSQLGKLSSTDQNDHNTQPVRYHKFGTAV